jgi:hypothetical protein
MGEAFAGPGAGFLSEKGDHCFLVFPPPLPKIYSKELGFL